MAARGKGAITAVAWASLLLVCLCAAPVAALADSGPAGVAAKKKSPKVRTEIGVATSVSQINVSAIATCPDGTRLVGGGFGTQLVFNGDETADAHLVSESRRLSDTQWIVSGFRVDNGPPGNPVQLTGYARCRRLATKGGKGGGGKAVAAKKRSKSNFAVSETSASLSVGVPFAAATATARCPDRRRAIAGGFSTGVNSSGPPINLAFPVESFRSGDSEWTTTMFLFSPLARTVTSYAYCARTKAPERSGDATLPGAEGSLAAAESRPCPRKRRLGGGGYRLPVRSPTLEALVLPVESRPGDSGWHTVATQQNDAVASTITSYGICL